MANLKIKSALNALRFLALTLALFITPATALAQDREAQTHAYAQMPGVDPNLLSLDIYGAAPGQSLPIIVMIHGGAWKKGDKAAKGVAAQKAAHYTRSGYVFISINYRLAPDHPFPAHAQDAATAIAFISQNSLDFGGDPNAIFVMGHSAGAHIAALIATDVQYLKAHALSLSSIKGVILLDTAAYDIQTLSRNNKRLPRLYRAAFGNRLQTWKSASPITHVAPGKNIPPMLIFHTARDESRQESQRFAAALKVAGSFVSLHSANDRSHSAINKEFGSAGDLYTQIADDFLTSLHAKQRPFRKNLKK